MARRLGQDKINKLCGEGIFATQAFMYSSSLGESRVSRQFLWPAVVCCIRVTGPFTPVLNDSIIATFAPLQDKKKNNINFRCAHASYSYFTSILYLNFEVSFHKAANCCPPRGFVLRVKPRGSCRHKLLYFYRGSNASYQVASFLENVGCPIANLSRSNMRPSGSTVRGAEMTGGIGR